MTNTRPTIPTNPIDIIRGFDNISSGLGNWIAGPEPQNAVAAAIQRRYRDACDSYSNGLDWVVGLTAPGRTVMSNICDPWLTSQGSGDPILASDPPPFIGGQCGVDYRFDVTTQAGNQQQPQTQRIIIRGPVGGTYWNELLNNPIVSVTNSGGYIFSLNPLATARTDPGGSPLQRTVVNGRAYFRIGLHQSGAVNGTISAVNRGRVDGLPDSCGSLPVPPPTVRPNPNPRPNPNLDDEEEPFVDDDGRPVIPMPEIDDPLGDPIGLPNFPLPPLFSDEPVGDGGPPTGPGQPGQPDDTGDGGESEGEAPEDSVLIGVKVDALQVPGYARKVQNVPFDVYIGALYVRLGWPDQLDLQSEAQFFEPGQFFVAPDNATAWKVSAAAGYNLRVTPYYVEKPPQQV